MSAFLDALGWQHAKTGAKGRPFSHEFDVLGMCLNLEDVCQGQVTLSNKQGRIERIVDRLQEGKLKRGDSPPRGPGLAGVTSVCFRVLRRASFEACFACVGQGCRRFAL